jgi:hypothetical protein
MFAQQFETGSAKTCGSHQRGFDCGQSINGKKKYLEFSTNILSSLTGQEWVSTTEEKTEARKSITLEAGFDSSNIEIQKAHSSGYRP